MSEKKNFSLPRFEGVNFISWKAQVEAILEWKNKLEVLSNDKPRSYAGTQPEADRKRREVEIIEFEDKDRYVRAFLLASLGADQVRSVIQCRTSKKIWEKLSSLHEQRSVSSRLQLQREFSNLKLGGGESINQYISRAEGLQAQLIDIGVKHIDEATLCCQIVCGLPDSYRSFMSTWANIDPDKQLVSELVARLNAEGQLVKRFEGETSALNAESKKHKKKKSKPKLKRCYECGEEGHFKRDCPKLEDDSEMKGDAAIC